MTFTDRLFVCASALVAGIFLFSLTGTLAMFAFPLLGILYLALGGKKK